MGRSPSCNTACLKKGSWTPEEDQKLSTYIQQHGHGSWRSLPQKAGLQRCGKSCRLRWINYLSPDIKRGNFSLHEERQIIQLHALLGNRWSTIAAHLPKRTDNEIKNHWNTHLKKRLAMMGIDPVTHKSNIATLGSANGDPKNASNLSHVAQWESARLEAEARLARHSQLRQHEPPGSSKSARLHNKMATTLEPPQCLDILKAWQNVCLTQVTGGGGRCNRGGSSNHNSHGFVVGFNGCCDLELPTSILPFSKIANLGTYSSEKKEVCHVENELQYNIDGESWTMEPGSLGDQTLIEINGGEADQGGIYEENQLYWNELLLYLVDCGPSN